MNKIKVLQFIAPSGFYGAEMWVLALAKHLDRERVDCSLAVTSESADQSMELYKRFCALKLPAYKIPMSGRFDIRAVFRLRNLIKKEGFSVLHTHGYKSDILGLMASRLAGIKIVSTPHGFENAPDLKLKLFIKMGCYALKKVDKVAPLSDELFRDVQQLGISNKKIQLIINGVDLDEIEIEREKEKTLVSTDKGEKIIGYIGQVAHRKNLGDMINAFDILYRKNKNVRLQIIGDGAKRKELEEVAAKLDSASKIEFLGYRKDRLKLLKEMDIFSMTSSLEGIPRCMMEAMGMGIPVAAFNIQGVDKLIIHEKTGLMAEFGNAEQLSKCWEQLLFDSQFAKMIAQNGRRHILENFSAKRMAEEYTGLFQELISSKQ